MPTRQSRSSRQCNPRFKSAIPARAAKSDRLTSTREAALEALLRMIVDNADIIDHSPMPPGGVDRTKNMTFLLLSLPDKAVDGLAALFADDAEREDCDPPEFDDHPEEDDHSGPDNPDDEPDHTGGDPDGAPESGNSLTGHSAWIAREFSINPILTTAEAA